jgi:DNA relaxase NicK
MNSGKKKFSASQKKADVITSIIKFLKYLTDFITYTAEHPVQKPSNYDTFDREKKDL